MPKATKLLIVIMAGVVLVTALVAVGLVLAGRDRNQGNLPAGETETSESSSSSVVPMTTWIAPFMMFIVIIALSQQESWPVTQAFAALRGNRPERRAEQARQYTSLRFSTSSKFARLTVWAVPKGEKTRVVSEGDVKTVVAAFADGSEYTFTVVKRAKEDPKGHSGYVIDDVQGRGFDATD